MQIPDVLADPRLPHDRARELGGFRTMLGVPMLAADRVVGVHGRSGAHKVAPFDDAHDRPPHDVRRAGRDRDPERRAPARAARRERELARSVDEQRALGEISQAGRLDARPRRGADDDRHARRASSRARTAARSSSSSPATQAVRAAHVLRHRARSWSERCAARGSTSTRRSSAGPPPSGAAQQAPDLAHETRRSPHRRAARGAAGARCWPSRCVREDEIIGALIVRRTVPGAFPDRTVELLETLASQSAVAIHNARPVPELAQQVAASSRSRAATSPSSWRQHVARAAHAAQRRDRLLRRAARADVRRAQRAPGRVRRSTSATPVATCSS